MPTVLITGTRRGIGLEFARQYAADGWRVIASARDPDKATELRALGNAVEVRRLDLDDVATADFAGAIGDDPLDLLISNAGVLGPQRIDDAEGVRLWLHELAVNTVAPTLLVRHAVPNLKAAGGKAVALTSRMGSIADNDGGGAIPYRSSKAALNAAWMSLSKELERDGIASAVVHPGWVQTDMGGAGGQITPAQSVAGLRRVFEGVKVGAFGFYNYDGTPIPW